MGAKARRVLVTVVTVFAVAAAGSLVDLAEPSPVQAAPAGDRAQPDARSAMAAARTSGTRVEDLSQRDEVTQVFANPDGTWTAETAPEAVRAKGRDGKWGDIDTTLEVRDGAVVPRLVASDVRFSAGGDRTLATMTLNKQVLEWRWPAALPEPVLDGDTATYPDVVPGGDLVVTATAEGFSHNVVLREAPRGSVDISVEVVTPGANLVKVPAGGLEVQTPEGKSLVQAPAPLMWDSSTNVVGDPQVKPLKTTVVRDRVGFSTLTLSPDAAFLSDPDTVYPVTIDPSITKNPSGDTWLQRLSNTSSMGGSAELRAGTYDGGSHIARSFISFSSTAWSGRQVLSASLKLRNFYSTDCDGANIRVARITKSWTQSALTWSNQPPASTATGDVDDFFQAYGASGCASADGTWNVTSIVQKWASGTANYGFKVFAKDETNNNSWRKYRSANYDTTSVRPRLIINYNTAPGTPGSLAIDPCVDTCSPRVTDSLTPKLSARASDVDNDNLTYTFQLADSGSTTPIATGSVGPIAQNTTATWQVPSGKLADDKSYQFRVGAYDGRLTTWSGWLGFSVGYDQPPAAPTQLSLSPCDGDCSSLVSTSQNPDLTAVVTDPDSDSVDALFELRKPGASELLESGSDLVTSGETARYTVPAGVLDDGATYEFRVGARDAKSTTWTNTWTSFKVQVDTSAPGSSLQLQEPLVIWDEGPQLTWTPYKDPTGAQGDDLVEYQIFRGCVTLPGTDGCPSPFGPDYTTDPARAPELVGTVDSDETTWTDDTAQPSAADANAIYYYWVGARTQDDVAHSRNAQVASGAQKVTTPRQGRVVRIFTGDLADTTISKTKPDTVLGRPADASGATGDWLQVGNAHPTYGVERALMSFDTGAIGKGLTVTDARLELHQVGGGGSGATVGLYDLTKSFVENEATWNNAQSTIPWTTAGGDLGSGPLASVTTDNSAKQLTFKDTAASKLVRDEVQGWVNDPTTNHGLALRTSVDTAQQWLNIASSEADPATQPRLVVEHLKDSTKATFVAPGIPQRYLPSTVTKVPVTVTNTSAEDWPSDLQLSYRWTEVGQSQDQSTANADRFVALGRALAPGESVKVDLTLRAPINSATGSKLKVYDLYLDLMRSDGTWWSDTHSYRQATLTDTERTERQCTVVKDGLLCPDRMVDAAGSSMLGLEKFFTYSGVETGAGSQLLTNLDNGNVVWSYDAMQNPSVGPSMFTRVVYNSQDTGDTGPGFDWSVQVATLTRLGSPLVVNGNDKSVKLVDGDGTEQVWLQNAAASTADKTVYYRPPGVPLELTGFPNTSDATKAWVFTRPDGTKFYFGKNLLPTSVVDMNGNALIFTHDAAGRLTKEVDAKGRTVAQLGWNTAGLSWIKDISGRALKFTHNSAHQLVALEDGGGFDPATLSFAGPVKKFTFAYTTDQPNSALLQQITDPRRVAGDPEQDQSTFVNYYVANEEYPAPEPTGSTPSFIEGWPKTVTDRMDRTTVFRYFDADGSDGNNILTKVIDTNPQDSTGDEMTTYRMDGYGRTISIKDANANAAGTNEVTALVWDADHNVVRLEEPNGAVSRWLYDRNTGYPLNIWDAEAVSSGGPPRTLTYDTVGDAHVLASISTPSGKTTRFGYDADANLTSVTDPLGNVTSYTYNPDGTQATATDAREAPDTPLDARQYMTTFNYDATKGADTGYPTRITPPAGVAPTDFEYDPRGNVTKTVQVGTDATLTTTAVYDAFGRPISITSPGAQGGDRTKTTEYDLNDNVTRSVAANKAVTSTTYFPDDQVKSQTLPRNDKTQARTRTYTYDVMGRLDTVTSPQGNVTSTDGDHVTRYDYDHVGQVTRIEQPLTGPNGETAVTTYDYDVVGNLVKVVDPRKNATPATDYTTRMVYDNDHRRTAVIDAAGYATRTRYDADGNVDAEIDQRGNVTDYTYDDDGRVASKTISHTPAGQKKQHWVTEYRYDEVGNLVRTIRPHRDDDNTPLFEESVFDANNQVIEKRGAFDPNSTVQRYQDPVSTFSDYDDLGRLARQSAPTRASEGQDWTTFQHYGSGDIKTSTDPWNITTSYEYNALGLQTQRVLKNAAGSATRTMSWSYYPDGSLASRDDAAAPTAAVVVDNSDSAQVTVSGIWGTATAGASKVGVDYRTHAAAASGSAGADDRFTWKVTAGQTGRYRLEVSCPSVDNGTAAASYTIDAAGSPSTAKLDHSACDNDRTWYRLGAFDFTGGQVATVSLAPSTDGTVVADAIRLVQIDNERSFTYEYDADGQQTRVNDQTPNARVDAYTTQYDDAGRPKLVQELSGTDVRRSTSYAYDINGNNTSVLAKRFADPSTDDRGNLASSRYTAYTWDARDLVETVTTGKTADDQNLKTWQYTYDPRGMRATWTKPAADGTATGNVTTYSYYETGLLRSMVERKPDNTLVASHQLWFNPDGDRTRDISRVQNADATGGYLDQTADYAYTPSRQLAKVTKSGASKSKNEEYTYDDSGNVDDQTVDGLYTDFDYDRDRLLSSTTSGTTKNYQYDGFGRLNSVTLASSGSTLFAYTYDGFDRTVQEKQTLPGQAQVLKTTGYDPFDRATLETTTIGSGAAKKTRFNYLGTTEQVAVEEKQDTTGTWKAAKTYSYGPDGRPLVLEDTPVDGSTAKTRLYAVNPHGDTETLTDPTTGNTKATYRYTAYGDTDKKGTTGEDKVTDNQDQDADTLNPYRYNSKRFDGATNKYDMGFRNYDPGLNRFLTRDMYNGALNDLALGTDPWHTNRYAFAGGNPVTGVELDGHRIIEDMYGLPSGPINSDPVDSDRGDGGPRAAVSGGGGDPVIAAAAAGSSMDRTTPHENAAQTAAWQIMWQVLLAGGNPTDVRRNYPVPGGAKNGSGRTGFADIVYLDGKTTWVWEVKSMGVQGKAVGEAAGYASKLSDPMRGRTGKLGWPIGGPYRVPNSKNVVMGTGWGSVVYGPDEPKVRKPGQRRVPYPIAVPAPSPVPIGAPYAAAPNNPAPAPGPDPGPDPSGGWNDGYKDDVLGGTLAGVLGAALLYGAGALGCAASMGAGC